MSLPPPRRPSSPPEPARADGLSAAVGRHQAGLGTVLVVAAAVGGGFFAWSRLAERIATRRDALLLPADVTLVGQADWITGDLRTDALRDASLDAGLPLDDPALATRLTRAFAIHPWVRQVESVTLRHPAAATVVIRCREPVAMVEVPGGLFAIDGEGVLLPSKDFDGDTARRYPRIAGITSGPRSGPGSTWGDPLVAEAAALAAVIGPEWRSLGIMEGRPVPATEGHDWELVGPGDLVIRFGAAPGRERPGEASAALKAARLRRLIDDPPTGGRIDVTDEEPDAAAPLQAIPAADGGTTVTGPAAGPP